MSEVWGDLICIPLVLSNSLQSPEQSIVCCSRETGHATSISDVWLIISRSPLCHYLYILVDETFDKFFPDSICFIRFLLIFQIWNRGIT